MMIKVRDAYQRRLISSVEVYDQSALPCSKTCRVELRDFGGQPMKLELNHPITSVKLALDISLSIKHPTLRQNTAVLAS